MRRSDVVALNGLAHARAEEARTDRTVALMRQITEEDGNRGEPPTYKKPACYRMICL